MEERDNLPFRINCEGYFLNSGGKILAKDSGKGFIMFPGGGMDEAEDIEAAMIRETEEETGITPTNLNNLGVLKILWGPDWAKTEKQKSRYSKFQGDEMHFFKGVVGNEVEKSNEEDVWTGEKFMEISDVINLIERSRPFDESVLEYREAQLRFLRSILDGKE
jgi:8-oxo-dGTP pyrophosphatase MutT (NUDIX family)